MIWKSLLALGAQFDYEIEQLDIITAFLESLIKETVYVEKLHRFGEPKGTSYTRVYHLLRAIYGLKQSPREWYLTLVDYLKSLGYERLEHDHFVFVHQNGIIIAIYVDNLLLFGPDFAKMGQLKKQLSDRFRMRDVGAISWYLGMEVTRDRANQTLFIDQTAFIDRMLEDLGMEKCKSAKVPMDSGTEIVKNRYMGEDYEATKEGIQGYQSLVGTLLWLAYMTRSDISFAVGKCSRYASNPISSHDVALKRIVRYLKESKELGLRYGPHLESKDGKLLGYTDASYGDCLDTHRSTSAYIYLLWNGPISWSSKPQTTVATLTAEAE